VLKERERKKYFPEKQSKGHFIDNDKFPENRMNLIFA